MLTQLELKNIFNYCEDTGDFTRLKATSNNVKVGDISSCKNTRANGKSYITITINYIPYLAHRLAWLYVTGEFPVYEIDHIDGNGVNNIFSNLRSVSCDENRKNKKKYSNNRSGVSGVSLHSTSGKWRVEISVNSTFIYLGLFDNFLDAVSARKCAEIKYGFHVNHGTERSL